MTLQRNNFILYKTIFLDFTLYVGQHKKERGNFDTPPFSLYKVRDRRHGKVTKRHILDHTEILRGKNRILVAVKK